MYCSFHLTAAATESTISIKGQYSRGVVPLFKSLLLKIQKSTAEKSEDTALRIQIATAVILLEVAHADDDFSMEEQNLIIDILREEFKLNEEEVAELMEVSDQKRRGTVDLWQFTRIINDTFDDTEKSRIIDFIWRVIFADGRLDKYEDHIVHKLATILHIPHSTMIQAKLKYLPDS